METGKYTGLKGKLGSLRISVMPETVTEDRHVFPASISITGSWPEFLDGNNLRELSRRGAGEVIEKICDMTGLDVGMFNVTRLDIATTLEMAQPVRCYLALFGTCGRYNKAIYDNQNVLYKLICRQFQFYDKSLQMRKQHSAAMRRLVGLNLLRGELRFTSRPHKQLKTDPISASMLSDERFFQTILEYWEREYHRIRKLKRLKNVRTITKQSEFTAMLASYAAQTFLGGELAIENLIEESQRAGVLSKQEKDRCKKKYRELLSHPSFTETDDLIRELDEKVHLAVSDAMDAP